MVKRIKSLEELVEVAAEIAVGKRSVKGVRIAKRLPFEIKLEGDTWDQSIDYRGARYVDSLQKQINLLYKNFSGYLPSSPPVIKVKVKKGSNILSPEFRDVAMHAINVMGPTGVTLSVIFAIACASGLGLYWLKLRNTEKSQALNIAESAIAALRDVARANQIDQSVAEKPFRDLARGLSDNDSVKLGKGEKFNGAQVKQLVTARRPRTTKEAYSCDGVYLLCKINLKDSRNSLVLELEQGNKKIEARTDRLPESVNQFLMDMVNSRRKQNQLPFQIELQIDVFCTKKSIRYGTVIALGNKRPGMKHFSLDELPPKECPLPLMVYTVAETHKQPRLPG